MGIEVDVFPLNVLFHALDIAVPTLLTKEMTGFGIILAEDVV